MYKYKKGIKLSDKQFNWAEKVVKGIMNNNLDTKKITDEVYNGNRATNSVIACNNKKNEKIIEYISKRLDELNCYKKINKDDVINRLLELIFSAKTKASDVSALAKTLGDYKGYTKPDTLSLNQYNLYNIDNDKLKELTQNNDSQ